MGSRQPYRVCIEDELAPAKYVVVVEQEECRTLHWQFFERRHAEDKANAEIARLKEQFSHLNSIA